MAEDIPDDIYETTLIVRILVRLGVKDLLRYKSVCKSWESLISDIRKDQEGQRIPGSRFVEAHLKHNLSNANERTRVRGE
ncbi:F-box/kelch-repeat protein-like protein, partial [Tanacetum coccineum]